PCGMRLQLSEDQAKQWVDCPRCGTVVNLPPEEPAPRARPPRGKRDGEEGLALDDPEARDRRREARARRRSLRGVARGLTLHYAAAFLFRAGVAVGMLAVVLALSARMYGWEKAAAAAGFFFPVGGVLLFLAGGLAAAAALLSLLAKPPAG